MEETSKKPNSSGSIIKLSGKRTRPYCIRILLGYELNEETGKAYPKYKCLGYAKTTKAAKRILADYLDNPYNLYDVEPTFSDIYQAVYKEHVEPLSDSSKKGYQAAYKACPSLHSRVFRELKTVDLEKAIKVSGKNYPTMKKIRVLFNQMYKYAMKNDICKKDYSLYVELDKYRDKNPNKLDRRKFTKEEIEMLWDQKDDKYYQTVLMLIYSGVRISEMLKLKKENVNLDEHYFDVIKSKTDSGIRRVPIADKVYPFFKNWYESSEIDTLLHTEDQLPINDWNYRNTYFKPLMKQLNMTHLPHDTRHTCISMLAEAEVTPTYSKMIVGHKGAMSMTEKTYTHIDMKYLLEAINKI